jgi:hypothetical protein
VDESQAVEVLEVSEARVKQWVPAALTMQQGMSLTAGRRRRARGPIRSIAPAGSRRRRRLVLGIGCLGLWLL